MSSSMWSGSPSLPSRSDGRNFPVRTSTPEIPDSWAPRTSEWMSSPTMTARRASTPRSVGRLVADVAMEGDDREAAHGQREDRIELLVADTRPGPAEEHDAGGGSVDDLHSLQILTQVSLVYDEAPDAAMGLGHIAGRARDGGEDTALADLHPARAKAAISRRVLD